MSCENLASKCKQQFKGVENFLRRIAFNLGNTPSRTEVKIISCIPIDVTDLQQKIKLLERELETARAKKQPVVQNLFCRHQNSSSLNSARKPNETCQTAGIEQCEGSCLKRSESMCSQVSLLNPTNSDNIQGCACWSSEISIAQTDTPEPKRGLFGRIKKNKTAKKKDKCKTHLVYYAQTDNSPFTYTNSPVHDTLRRIDTDAVNQTYLAKALKKQYTTKTYPFCDEYSIVSKFSSPVCRDTDQIAETCTQRNLIDSDLCSCLHGNFHNIDQHVSKEKTSLYSCDNNKTTDFYDSSLYDIIPVKEVPEKTPARICGSTKKRSPRHDMDPAQISESYRQRYRYHPFIDSRSKIPDTPFNYSRKPPKIVDAKRKYQKQHKRENLIDKNCLKSSSKSCYIVCSDVYPKPINASDKTQPVIERIVSVTQKSAACLTTCMNTTECQTTTTQSVQIEKDLVDDNKTEETLDQIKAILQTVLTEVKTNAQIKKETVEKSTKDAVVQKDISQRNMPGCSSLLHSFTYSSHNIDPTSCSRQIDPGACFRNTSYGFGMMPGKYIHNFPVFIHTPGRNTCTSCYRHSPKTNKTSTPKQAVTAATNTDRTEYTKETEKLIKEIYKSMAVNMQINAKETSASEYEDLKSVTRQSLNKILNHSDILNRQMKSKTTSSHKIARDSLLNREFASNTLSLRSQIVSSTHTGQSSRNSRKESHLGDSQTRKRRQHKIIEEDYEEITPSTSGNESSTLTEDNAEYYIAQPVMDKKKPEKKSIFGKMFKRSIKLFGTRNKKRVGRKQHEVAVEARRGEHSEDDSDDYETVYSQSVPHREYINHIPYSYRNQILKAQTTYPHTNIGNKRINSPYMEQEYRRCWDEKLMFKNYKKAPSEVHSSLPYWQNYEARSALVSRSSNKTEVSRIPRGTLTNHIASKPLKRYNRPTVNVKPKGISWLKKHKPGIKCGRRWKKFILEN